MLYFRVKTIHRPYFYPNPRTMPITRLLLLPVITLSLLISGCGEVAETKAPETAPTVPNTTTPPGAGTAPAPAEPENPTELVPPARTPLGSYVGQFEAEEINDSRTASYSNRITIVVEVIAEETASGRSIVAGNIRPWTGTARELSDGRGWRITAAEPGDDRYDGVFEFTLSADGQTLSGDWRANDDKLAVSRRGYVLERRSFAYDPSLQLTTDYFGEPLYGTEKMVLEDEYEFPVGEVLTDKIGEVNASARELTAADVENLYAGDLEVIRNAIYARHGYSFKNRKMR